MNVARTAARSDAFLSSRDRFQSHCTVALMLTAAFAAYISWVPFDFTAASPEAIVDALRTALAPTIMSRANFVANVVLFIPFGLFGGGALGLERHPGSKRTAWSAVLLLCSVLLSVLIEGVQILLPGRTPASADVIAQTGGTAIGLAAWLAVGSEVRAWIANRHAADPIGFLLQAAVGGLVVASLFPLDVTVSLSTLAQKYRNGGILLVPFQHQGSLAGLLPDVLTKMLFALPLGAWCVLGWTTRGQRRGLVHAIAASTLFLSVLEMCQVVIISRVADVTDILTGTLGAAVGAWIAASRSSARARIGERPRLALAGLAASIAIYAASNWSPFDFTLSKALFEERWPELTQVPFASYYNNPEAHAIGTFALKFSMTVPIGLFFGSAAGRARREFGRLLLGASTMLAGVLLFAIEFGQIFLPSRFPDVTDVLIGMLGFGSGLAIAQSFHELRRQTRL